MSTEVPAAKISIIRQNLMDCKGYAPYCGSTTCRFDMPRTYFNGAQFTCKCGWQSAFGPEFIAAYKAKWKLAHIPEGLHRERWQGERP